MIKNDIELAVAKKEVEQIIASHSNSLMPDADMILMQKLQTKISEYEALVSHNPENPILLEVESVEKIVDLPIKASIAFKITSQELAKICESETMVQTHQNCDESNYASDFLSMMKILGVQLIDDLFFVAQMSSELKQKLQFLRMGECLHNNIQEAA
ncbi:hypothetical protein NIES4071_04250 [Calothrix sp. NIES-4071]|nr:hypothetical protein NIES4071_04250 [Calothrix sp. NIES-4071]BAZ54771.1 hypothetical protein NIES4105_04240 [Calothrix sp. NIES-4105]